MSKLEKILLGIDIIIYGLLAIFSYAYVDLNLTISQNPLALKFVGLMQQLGYYHRPQAVFIYIVFIIVAFSFFIANLILFYKNRVGLKYLKTAVILNTLILIFAYPFLSSDIFNYMFDAKIITHYHLSPYTHKALDFPRDDWIRFMRWVHRYSPYGPGWLAFSLFPSILGFGKFLLTFFTFKIFISVFYLINAKIIFKTLQKVNPQKALFGTAFYAFNPLFLIEGIASGHNDLVFATFLLLPIYFSLQKRKEVLSYLIIFLGVLIKYISILNLPWYILKMKMSFESFVAVNIVTMAIFTVIYSTVGISVPFVSPTGLQVQFQPWYLFWTLPFIALIPKPSLILISISLAMGAMLRYPPFIYNGDWSQPGTLEYMKVVTIIPVIAALSIVIVNLKLKNK